MRQLCYALAMFLSLIMKMYTSNFTSIHGFNDFTRFVDYHVSDAFSVILFSFIGLNLLYNYRHKYIKNVGYYIGIAVTITAFITEYLPYWACGNLTKTGDKIDMIMYVVGFGIFSLLYYFIEKLLKKHDVLSPP